MCRADEGPFCPAGVRPYDLRAADDDLPLPPSPRGPGRGRARHPDRRLRQQHDTSSSGGANDPAKAIPASAPFYLEATVRPTGKQRTDLEAALSKILRTDDPGAKITELIDKAGKKKGKSYAKDIKPWLGDKAAVALTRLRRRPAPVRRRHQLDRRRQGRRRSSTSRQSYTTKRSFEGTDYRYDPSDKTAAAVVKHYLVIASEPSFKQVAHLLDKGGDSLGSNQDLQDARVEGRRAPRLHVRRPPEPPAHGRGQRRVEPRPGELSAINSLFKRYRAFGVGIGADAQAIRLSLATLGGGSPAATARAPRCRSTRPRAGPGWRSRRTTSARRSGLLDSLKDVNSGSGGGPISTRRSSRPRPA